MEQKKNNYIVPATFFTALSPTKRIEPVTIQKEKTIEKPTVTQQSALPKEPTETLATASKLKDVKRRPSALSLKSVHRKKEETIVSVEEESFDDYPRTAFDEVQLKNYWEEYHLKLQKIGEEDIASILITNIPELKPDFEISLTLPSELMKTQLEREKPKLLRFLREKLNNYGISITIDVNELVKREFIYTNSEKYQKLKEKNPMLEKLKSAFDLEI